MKEKEKENKDRLIETRENRRYWKEIKRYNISIYMEKTHLGRDSNYIKQEECKRKRKCEDNWRGKY